MPKVPRVTVRVVAGLWSFRPWFYERKLQRGNLLGATCKGETDFRANLYWQWQAAYIGRPPNRWRPVSLFALFVRSHGCHGKYDGNCTADCEGRATNDVGFPGLDCISSPHSYEGSRFVLRDGIKILLSVQESFARYHQYWVLHVIAASRLATYSQARIVYISPIIAVSNR